MLKDLSAHLVFLVSKLFHGGTVNVEEVAGAHAVHFQPVEVGEW